MASRRVWTWPTIDALGRKGIQRPKFVLVGGGELEDAQGPLKVEGVKQEASPSRPRKLSRSLGLETVYLRFREIQGHSVVEETKIVISTDLRSICYTLLLHIIPIGASVTLCAFNWKGYYIGGELSGPVGEDGLKFLGIQFAAKMLELLAMASLAAILFALVRARLVSDSLPFGAVTAGFDFNKLSLLWSKEFVAICAASFSRSTQKALFIATIIIFTILGATIAPSAAIAAQPVLRNWPAGGTAFWLNATSQELWPSRLDEVALPDLPCTSSQNTSCFPANYNLLAGEILSFWPSSYAVSDDGMPKVMPEKALVSGHQSVRTLAARYRGQFIYQPQITAATAPSAAIADAVSQIGRYWYAANTHQCSVGKGRFCYYNDIFYTVEAMQPVTYVKCYASDINTAVRFPRLDQGIGNYPLVDYSSTVIGSQQWFDVTTGNGSIPGLSWVELPEVDFGRLSIGVAIALPGTNTNETPGQVFACTIDARWAHATATLSFSGGPMVVSGLPVNWFFEGQLQLGSNGLPLWPQIKIAPEWAESINRIIAEPSASVFATLCNSVGRLDNILMAPSSTNALESVLAVMITDSLARTSSTATILGSLKRLKGEEWMDEVFPKGSVFGPGGSAFNYSYRGGDQSTKFEARTTVNGYGYGSTRATILSTLVLSIYSLIAMIYVVYSSCFAKTTSSSWESITGLVALAANSRPSPAMRNTGAGIDTLGTLKQPVKVGVSDGRLQIIFEDRESIDKITRNELYG